jgi:hypothetical protein
MAPFPYAASPPMLLEKQFPKLENLTESAKDNMLDP